VAQSLERKIILSDGQLWFTTVNEDYQLASLYQLGTEVPFDQAKPLLLPAGRNITEDHNPFSWDLWEDEMMAINFLDHPMNDRNEAIKRINLQEVREFEDMEIIEYIMGSTRHYTWTLNDPYLYLIQENSYLKNFHFDAIWTKSGALHFLISNAGEARYWIFDQGKWTSSDPLLMGFEDFFSLFEYQSETYVLSQGGGLFKLSIDENPEIITMARPDFALQDKILVLDRDADRMYYLPQSVLEQSSLSFKELMEQFGQELRIK
jgi:hypothetical protein